MKSAYTNTVIQRVLLCFLVLGIGAFSTTSAAIEPMGGDFFPKNQSSLRYNGITYDSHPLGTAGVQFNLFTDDSYYAQLKRQITFGLNKEKSEDQGKRKGNMMHFDERDFSAVRRVHPDISVDEKIPYVNGIFELKKGETIKVLTYVHNNSKQVCGGGNHARNTVVELDWSDPNAIVSSISADNATPKTINDKVKLSYDGEYTLKMINSVLMDRIDPDGTPTGNECGSTNQGWKTRDVASNSKKKQGARFNFGNVAASYGSVKVLITQFKVVSKDSTFSISKTSRPANNTTIEAGDRIKYTVTVEPKGEFAANNVVLEDELDHNVRFIAGGHGVETDRELCVDPGPNVSEYDLKSGYFGCFPTVVRLNFGTIDKKKSLSFTVKAVSPPGSGDTVEVCNRLEFDGGAGMKPSKSNKVCLDVEPGAWCGNSRVDRGEVCDDGNNEDGDTCSADCKTKGACGNGIVDAYEKPVQCGPSGSRNECPAFEIITEECDDGNTVGGDGCSADCSQIEECGNGVVEQGEVCDDGNTAGGDGCNETCTDTHTCGNNIVEEDEVCDDGNTVDDETCAADCGSINGCGNGEVGDDEGCDDGNVTDGDGCSSRCQVEAPGRGSGGGGGSAPRNPQIGTCVLDDVNRGPMCVPRYPDRRTDEAYPEYEACLDAEGRTNDGYAICLRHWSRVKGFPVCGWVPDEEVPEEIPIPYHSAPQERAMEVQCNIIPDELSCNHCPGCFGISEVKKEIKQKNGSWSDQANIVRGDEVEYQLSLTLGDFNKPNQRILSGDVTFYDLTIPSESGNIWHRKGIDGAKYSVVKKHFEKRPIKNIKRVNQGKSITESIRYTMNSELAIDKDVAQLQNVAFAIFDYRYEVVDAEGKKQFKTDRIGISADGTRHICDALADRDTNELSTLGSIATANVLRPFIDAKSGGNIGFENFSGDNDERLTGNIEAIDEQVGGENVAENAEGDVFITSGRIYIPDENNGEFDFKDQVEQENLEDVDEFTETEGGNILEQLKLNREEEIELPVFPGTTFTHSPDSESIYFRNGTMSIDKGVYDLGGKSMTVIIEDGNLVLHGDFEVTNGFIAFVLVEGNVILESDVRRVDGIYITENGAFEGEESSYQLQVSGAFIGDTYQLLKNRNYIGEDPDAKLEPNVRFLFDLRMVEETPPGLEQFLGEGWTQL